MDTTVSSSYNILLSNSSQLQVKTTLGYSLSLHNSTLSQSGSQTTAGGPYFNEAVIAHLDIFFSCFCLHFLSLLGFISNVLNIAVLSRHSFQETTTIWLMSMSFNDLMSSVFQPLRRINCIIDQFDPVNALTFRAVSVVYLVNIPDIFISVSIFHTMAIALERLVAVWFPLRVSQIFTVSRVKWTVGVMYVYTLIMLSPTWFFLDFGYVFDKKYNATRGAYYLSHFYAGDYDTLTRYAVGGLTYLFSASTFLTIVLCTAVASLKLTVCRRRTLVNLASATTSVAKQVRDLKVVKMLLTVCVVNAVISVPGVAIQQFLLYSNLSVQSASRIHYLLRTVVNVMYQFNAVVNFIIYVTMSTKFATTLRLLCTRRNHWTR